MRQGPAVILLVVAIVLVAGAGPSIAQTWSRTYSSGNAALFSPDGDLIVAGAEDIDGTRNGDGTLTRIDAYGDVVWSVAHGAPGDDYFTSLAPTADGGYLAVGAYDTSPCAFVSPCTNLRAVKFDASGVAQWEKTYSGIEPGGGFLFEINPVFASVAVTSDGGFLIGATGWLTNSFSSDITTAMYVFRLDSSGTMVWQKYFEVDGFVLAGKIHATSDDGFILPGTITGSNTPASIDDGLVIRGDSNGALQWSTVLGGPDFDRLEAAEQTSDGGFLVAGRTRSYGAGRLDGWLIKLDASGSVSWQKTYGGAQKDDLIEIVELSGGNFLLAGSTQSLGPDGADGWLVKIDPSGVVLWEKTYGEFEEDRLGSVDESASGDLVALGSSRSFSGSESSEHWVLRLQSDGSSSSPCSLEGGGTSTVADSSMTPATTTVVTGNATMSLVTSFPSSLTATVTYSEQCPCATCSADAYESDDSCVSTTTTIQNGEVQSHNFWEDDSDWITFSACAGRGYTIETSNLGASTDTVLYVFDRDCNGPQLANNDDFGGTLASRIVFYPPADGNYHIWVEQANHATRLPDLTYDISISGDTSPCSTWARSYGGTGNDFGVSVAESVEGQLVVAANTDSFGSGGDDGWVISTDPDGVVSWTKTYGSAGEENLVGVEALNDGRLVVGGDTDVVSSRCTLSLWWLDAAGTVLDELCKYLPQNGFSAAATAMTSRADVTVLVGTAVGLPPRYYAFGARSSISTSQTERLDDFAMSPPQHEVLAAASTGDGHQVYAGWIDEAGTGARDTFILRSSSWGGNVPFEDQYVYRGAEFGEAVAVAETADRGYAVLARRIVSGTPDQTDMWLIKHDRYGTVEWQRIYRSLALANEEPADLIALDNGDLLIAGTTDETSGGDLDIVLLRTDGTGQIAWQKRYGGSADDAVSKVRETVSGALVVAGRTQSFGSGADDVWLLKITPSGELLEPCGLETDTALTSDPAGDAGAFPGVAPVIDSNVPGTGVPTVSELTPSEGQADQCLVGCSDLDGDTWTDCAGDCDNNDASVYPGAPQLCDGINNDCDSVSPLWPDVPTDELDDDGDGFVECEPWVGGGGGGGGGDGGGGAGGDGPGIDAVIGGGDCDDTEAHTYPGAPEWNDGKDNQCPGDAGYGTVDEISGASGFTDPDKDRYSWTSQPAATLYEAVRSTLPDFSAGCESTETSDPFWVDAASPAAGSAFFYLSRALSPFQGSWGRNWQGAERSVPCVEVPLWSRTLGGTQDDFAHAIEPTSDGGFLVAGSTRSFGGGLYDVWVVKLDELGAVVWEKTFGGSNDDEARSIRETADGGAVVVGYSRSYRVGVSDVWVIKLDAAGAVEWQRNYDESGGTEEGNSIWQTTDGGYIVAASRFFDTWVLKLTSTGTVSWSQLYSTGQSAPGDSIRQTNDTWYAIAGEASLGQPGTNGWMLKINQSGFVAWQKSYGGAATDEIFAMEETANGQFIVAGRTASSGFGSYDAWLMKLDASGNVIWKKTYGNSGSEELHAVQPTSDGGNIAAGVANNPTTFGDVLVIKVDASGSLIWSQVYGGTGGEIARSVRQTDDGRYVVAGEYGGNIGDVWILRLDRDGTIDPSCTFSIGTNVFEATSSALTNVGSGSQTTAGTGSIASSASGVTSAATVTEQCASP